LALFEQKYWIISPIGLLNVFQRLERQRRKFTQKSTSRKRDILELLPENNTLENLSDFSINQEDSKSEKALNANIHDFAFF